MTDGAGMLGRGITAAGALACGIAVALAAYASHGLQGEDAHRAGLAASFAFGHGLALLLLAPSAGSRLRQGGLLCLLAGLALFAGSLLATVFLDMRAALAPAGGSLLMLGWLLVAIDALRR